MSISFNSGVTTFKTTKIDEEQLKALLLDFRPFVLKKSHIELPRIFDLIHKANPSQEVLSDPMRSEGFTLKV